MSRAVYTEIECKSALNRVTGMPFHWSINPYRGCVHACHYCYARSTHSFFGLNAGSDFETRIFVKKNLPVVLRRELAKPTWGGERVSIGTATDPYQPGEGRYRLTRGVIEAMRDFRNPLSIVTKSTLVLRDGDLLAELAHYADVTVQFTVTTLDPVVWKAVEPGTPPPWQRFAVMRRLVDSGVRCGLFVAPILPGITDSVEMLESVINGAKEHGASHVWASPLRLSPMVKEHYFGFVDEHYPQLAARYDKAYPDASAPKAYQEGIERRVDSILARYGFAETRQRVLRKTDPDPSQRTYRNPVQQLTLTL